MLENLPLLQGGSVVQLHLPVENRREVDSTIQLLERFGVKARWQDEHRITVPGGQSYQPCHLEMPQLDS